MTLACGTRVERLGLEFVDLHPWSSMWNVVTNRMPVVQPVGHVDAASRSTTADGW
jgi:hypothetical protein